MRGFHPWRKIPSRDPGGLDFDGDLVAGAFEQPTSEIRLTVAQVAVNQPFQHVDASFLRNRDLSLSAYAFVGHRFWRDFESTDGLEREVACDLCRSLSSAPKCAFSMEIPQRTNDRAGIGGYAGEPDGYQLFAKKAFNRLQRPCAIRSNHHYQVPLFGVCG